MNDENQKVKNIYQGNYDNDYKEGLKASEHIDSEKKFCEEPCYMNLGAPRDRDEVDKAHHEKAMNSLFGNVNLSSLGLTSKKRKAVMKVPKQPGGISKFLARRLNLYLHGPHFKILKNNSVRDNTMSTKIKWSLAVIVVTISVASFATQSFLFIKDRLSNNQMAVVETPMVLGNSEQRGSDDEIATTSINKAPQYRLNDINHFPVILAKSYLVADLKTGEIIKESQDTKPYPLASMSKLMTALVAHEKMDSQQMAIVSRSSYNTFGTQGELLLGESIRISDLMYPLLMESSNDGAEVIADAYGHANFMTEMNKKAISLGMVDTYYNDPSGLDAKNVSTVDDQFKLVKYIYEKAPVIFDLTRVRQFEIINHRWYNKNKIMNIDSFLGGKNGFIDESRQTTASLFDIQLAKGGKRAIAIILLKTNDREGDVVKIINFLKKNAYYEIINE